METDEALVDQVSKGDQLALRQLYDRHRSLVYSVAMRITADSRTSEEIIQDAFFQLWQKARLFDSARGSLVGWLLTITRNRALSRLRQAVGQKNDVLLDGTILLPIVTGPNNLEHQIARQLVTIAMAELPEAQRETITLAYFDGLTCQEIAARTQTPLGTTKTRLRAALTTMRKSLADPSLQRESARTACLADILITDELFSRACREPNSDCEKKSLERLTAIVATSPGSLVQTFLEMAIDLCKAGTAGLSFLEENNEHDEVFRWTHLAGTLAKHVGGTTPRNFSPCGVTLDRNSPQLFKYPGRYFHYFNEVECPIVEGLVLPFAGRKRGTVWIVSHNEGAKFDLQDVRVMTALTNFVGSAFQFVQPGNNDEVTQRAD